MQIMEAQATGTTPARHTTLLRHCSLWRDLPVTNANMLLALINALHPFSESPEADENFRVLWAETVCGGFEEILHDAEAAFSSPASVRICHFHFLTSLYSFTSSYQALAYIRSC